MEGEVNVTSPCINTQFLNVSFYVLIFYHAAFLHSEKHSVIPSLAYVYFDAKLLATVYIKLIKPVHLIFLYELAC